MARPKTGGRQRGTPNRVTAAVKEAVQTAFDEAGGVKYLLMVAKTDPRTFCGLLGRIIPMQINGQVDHTHREIVEERANKFTEAMQSLIERAESKARPN